MTQCYHVPDQSNSELDMGSRWKVMQLLQTYLVTRQTWRRITFLLTYQYDRSLSSPLLPSAWLLHSSTYLSAYTTEEQQFLWHHSVKVNTVHDDICDILFNWTQMRHICHLSFHCGVTDISIVCTNFSEGHPWHCSASLYSYKHMKALGGNMTWGFTYALYTS